ncbi:MAG: hypothetical protein ABW005_07830 [Burkholderiaceae bacterium]
MNNASPTLAPPTPARWTHDQSSALQRHLLQCERSRGRWFGVALLAERVHGLVAPRLTTTVAVAGLALGLALYWA